MDIIFYTPGHSFDKRKQVVTIKKKPRYNNFTFGTPVVFYKSTKSKNINIYK